MGTTIDATCGSTLIGNLLLTCGSWSAPFASGKVQPATDEAKRTMAPILDMIFMISILTLS
jgi:hypothetical protein